MKLDFGEVKELNGIKCADSCEPRTKEVGIFFICECEVNKRKLIKFLKHLTKKKYAK